MIKSVMLTVTYTERADKDGIAIKEYLLYKFTQKEVGNFHKLLIRFENVIVNFPKLYPKSSTNKNVHRAVLSKQLSVFYKPSKTGILVIAILDNRMDYTKWP